MEKETFSDHLEKQLADCLKAAQVQYRHESLVPGQRLDFYLPDFDVYIEVKQFYSDRLTEQLKAHDNVILLQGRKAVDAFARCLSLNANCDLRRKNI
jgi:hypothetical protein